MGSSKVAILASRRSVVLLTSILKQDSKSRSDFQNSVCATRAASNRYSASSRRSVDNFFTFMTPYMYPTSAPPAQQKRSSNLGLRPKAAKTSTSIFFLRIDAFPFLATKLRLICPFLIKPSLFSLYSPKNRLATCFYLDRFEIRKRIDFLDRKGKLPENCFTPPFPLPPAKSPADARRLRAPPSKHNPHRRRLRS